MTVEIFLVLSLVVAAMVVFTFEWLPVDVTTLVILMTLMLTGILSPGEAFAGFASEIIVILASIFVISGALVRTGVMSWLGHFIDRQLGKSENKIVLFIMTLSASLSAFINNTNATAVLMPAALDLSKRNEMSPSKLLMPLAFASILGGTCTLIGTSTNVAASGMLQRLGFEPYSLFEFSIVGIVVAIVGVLYFSIVGYRFLPETAVASLSEKYEIEAYLSSLLVPEGSSLIDQTLEQAPFSDFGLTVLAIERAGDRLLPRPDSVIGAGDVLVVHGDREALFKVKESPDLHIETDATLGEEVLAAEDAKLVEAIVMPSSSLAQRNLKQLRFRQRFGASVLGIYRRQHGLASGIRDLPLRVGDVVLLQGSTARLNALQDRRDVWLLGEVEHVPVRPKRGVIAVLALTTAIVLSATEFLPLSVALLAAGLTVVLARCIPAHEIYTLIEWRLLVLIGGMTAVGAAMVKTDAAELVAGGIVQLALPYGLYFVLGALAILTIVLTQPLSNAAAVLVVLPIALSTADQLALNPRTFAVMVTLAASLSFITPFEPSSLLVYGPGGYRFRDFVKAGLVMTVIALAILMVLVPVVWPP
jgi:di/tricarboxylate transporter